MKLEVNSLCKRYGKIQALNQLSFESPPTSGCLGILGRNGAGKSTLLKILVGLLAADSGDITLSRGDQTYDIAGARLAAFIPENPCLLGNVLVRDFLKIIEDMNRLVGVSTDHDLKDVLIRRLDLQDSLRRRVSTLSKGNKRKIELVAACSANVDLLIADELTAGIDVAGRIALEEIIRNTISKQRQLLISSHDLSFICGCCDSVLIIERGRVAEHFCGPVETGLLKAKVEAAFGDQGIDDAQSNRPAS